MGKGISQINDVLIAEGPIYAIDEESGSHFASCQEFYHRLELMLQTLAPKQTRSRTDAIYHLEEITQDSVPDIRFE